MSQYDKIAHIYENFMGDEGDIPHQILFDPPLIKLLPHQKGFRILDIGCGNGYWTKKLAARYASVVGIDSSAKLINIAKEKRSAPNITYLRMNLENKLDFDNEHFSFIFSNMVLHYVRRIQYVASELYRVLKPDGILLISITHPLYEVIKFPHLSDKAHRTKYVKNALEETSTLTMYYEPLQSFKQHFLDVGFKLVNFEEVVINEDFAKHYPRYSNRIGMPRAAVFRFRK